MEAKHTPGPWEVDVTTHQGVSYGFSGVRTVSEEGYGFPHRSYTRTICQTPHGLRTDDAEPLANMRLIAAAPDLLGACREAKDYLIRDLVEPGRTVFWKLIDAIKKADGGGSADIFARDAHTFIDAMMAEREKATKPTMLEALRVAEAFIAHELEQRQGSGLPDSDPYMAEAKAALDAVRGAIEAAEKRS